MPKNITMQDLLGNNLNSLDYGVSTNWRIDFSKSKEFTDLLGKVDGDPNVPVLMSISCHSKFQFETNIEYATASIKGIPISQAAWQDRTADSVPVDVYDAVDHRVFKALVMAANNTAGYYANRDIAEKNKYTMNGIVVHALGNAVPGKEPPIVVSYQLLGVQINTVQSPEYNTESASINSVRLDLKWHGWTILNNNT
jgi:hypothetical protein